jgi:hypothetical protein
MAYKSTVLGLESLPKCDRYEFLSLNLKTTVIRKRANSPKSENTIYLEADLTDILNVDLIWIGR